MLAGGEAFATMTTVGYGGSRTTELGRVITIALLLVGIGFVAVLTGAVAERFLASDVEEVAETEAVIATKDAEVLAELRQVRMRLDRLEARLERRTTAR